MRKLSKIVSMLLALVMLLSMSSIAAAEDASALEPVTLEWYVLEQDKPDSQLVFNAINAYLQEKINTTINFHFVEGTEYKQKISTILMSGQAVDIVNSNDQIPYVEYVKKGAFAPMDELLAQYAPETIAMIPEGYWDAMRVDGQVYGIPSYKDSCQFYCVQINKTLADALGLELPESVKNYQDMVPILYEAYEKRNEMFPDDAALPICRNYPDLENWAQYETIHGLAVVNIPGVEDYEGMGAGEKVFNKYATKEYREMSKTIAKMTADGLLPTDLFYYDSSRLYDQAGKYLVPAIGSGYVYMPLNQNSSEWDTIMIPYQDAIGSTSYLHNAVECISASSKNKERAMMVLELVNTDDFVATALRFGIEGEHYNLDAEGRANFAGTKNEDPANRAYYTWYGAQFGALTHVHVPSTYPTNFAELLEKLNQSANTQTNMGFIFDTTSVQNEIGACNNVIKEYETNLKFGYVDVEDVDANIDEFLAQLEANGVDKIIAEAQAQLDAWRAVNKK